MVRASHFTWAIMLAVPLTMLCYFWASVHIGYQFGMVIVLSLMNLKLRFPVFPLHPMAFPLVFSWAIDALLPAITLAWVIKALLLRYEGLRAHQRALPLFLGLIVGDACVSVAGTVLSHALLGR